MKLTIMPATDRRPATITEARTTAARFSEQAREAAIAKAEAEAKWQRREQIGADALQVAILAGKPEPTNIAATLTAERDRTRERHAALVELETRAHESARATVQAEAANGWAKAEQETADAATAEALAALEVLNAKLDTALEANAVLEWVTDASRGQVRDYTGTRARPDWTEQVKSLLGITGREMAEFARKQKREARERKAAEEAAAEQAAQRRRARYAEQDAAEAAMPSKTVAALARSFKQVG